MFKQTSCVSVQSSLCVCVLRAHGIESIICTHCWPLAYSVNLPQFCNGINIPWACHRRLKELSLQSSYAIKCDSINLHRISTYDENECDNWYTDSRAISYAVTHVYSDHMRTHNWSVTEAVFVYTHKIRIVVSGSHAMHRIRWNGIFIRLRVSTLYKLIHRYTTLTSITHSTLFFPQHIRQ